MRVRYKEIMDRTKQVWYVEVGALKARCVIRDGKHVVEIRDTHKWLTVAEKSTLGPLEMLTRLVTNPYVEQCL